MEACPTAVSVIVPAYNVTRYIAEALDSLLAQTFQQFEAIVVNDGCPDTPALERVLEQYQSRMRYIKQANTGVSGACNAAILAAQFPLILRLDPDDILEPTCLESQVGFMQAHPEFDVCYVNSSFFGGSDSDGKHWMDLNPSEGEVTFLNVMAGRTAPASPGSIIRREALIRAGLYDTTLHSWEDFDMWLRILRSGGRIAYNREPLVRYRRRRDSLSAPDPRYMDCAVRVLDKAEAAWQLTTEERAALERRREVAKFDLEILRGKAAIERRDWRTAREHFEYCLGRSPSLKLRAVVFALRCCPWALNFLTRSRGTGNNPRDDRSPSQRPA